MSGGIAYVYDVEGNFVSKINKTTVVAEAVTDSKEAEAVKKLIENHYNYTGSKRAKEILENWSAMLPKFVKVTTEAYKALLAKKEAV